MYMVTVAASSSHHMHCHQLLVEFVLARVTFGHLVVGYVSPSFFEHVVLLFRGIKRMKGCRKFVPVLGGDCPEKAPPGDICDQISGDMSSLIRDKLAEHVGDHVLLFPERGVLRHPRGRNRCIPLHYLNDSLRYKVKPKCPNPVRRIIHAASTISPNFHLRRP